MPQIINVPGMGQVQFPDGMTDDQIANAIKSNMQPQHSTLGNIAMGALKGATDIGSTLLAPVDWALNKTGLSHMTNDQRRAALSQFYQQHADPTSTPFALGALGTQVAGTAGVGGALGKVVTTSAKVIPAAIPYAQRIATALQSGGLTTGSSPTTLAGKAADMALRSGAGATVGGVSAGMIDPNQAGNGAFIGGIAPSAIKLAGTGGRLLKSGAANSVAGTLGATSGVGTEAVKTAYQSGKDGTTAFAANMRGQVPMQQVIDDAKTGLANMRAQRAAAYRNGMAQVSGDKTVLDFAPIQQTLDSVQNRGTFNGQVINKNAAGTVGDLAELVNHWGSLDPSTFHTPEGLDALKQAVGDIRDTTQFGTGARNAADNVYNAVKGQITNQAPVYAKVMGDYSDASDTLGEITRALSLGDKASADTSMRKLQSLMRNNVNTNYGNRLDLANTLQDQGGKSILPAIAGQSMNSLMPRGLAGLAQKGGLLYALMNPSIAAHAAALAPITSPRVVGEGAYALGKLVGGTGNAASNIAGTVSNALPNLPSQQDVLSYLLRAAPVATSSAAQAVPQ